MLFDRLTGALKKEVFEYFLKMEIERAIRYPLFFSMAVVELDRVNGRKNETRESLADLRTLANLFRMELRKSDVLGVEKEGVFCWIMPETDERGAQVVGERMRKAVEGFGFNGRRRTMSAGIVSFPSQSLDLSDMVEKARGRLARANSLGGNQVCMADEISFPNQTDVIGGPGGAYCPSA